MTLTDDLFEITCPECGTVSHFSEMRKRAEEFCRRCDYPLFWVRRSLGGDDEGGDSDTGLRRLPGAGGWQGEVSVPCPVCSEPNRFDTIVCVRCGSDVRPAPVVVAPPPEPLPPPPPPPEPPPAPKRRIWPLVVIAVVCALVVLGVVLWLALR